MSTHGKPLASGSAPAPLSSQQQDEIRKELQNRFADPPKRRRAVPRERARQPASHPKSRTHALVLEEIELTRQREELVPGENAFELELLYREEAALRPKADTT